MVSSEGENEETPRGVVHVFFPGFTTDSPKYLSRYHHHHQSPSSPRNRNRTLPPLRRRTLQHQPTPSSNPRNPQSHFPSFTHPHIPIRIQPLTTSPCMTRRQLLRAQPLNPTDIDREPIRSIMQLFPEPMIAILVLNGVLDYRGHDGLGIPLR